MIDVSHILVSRDVLPLGRFPAPNVEVRVDSMKAKFADSEPPGGELPLRGIPCDFLKAVRCFDLHRSQ